MTIHKEPHPLSGAEVTIKAGEFAGAQYRVEDWWDRLAGRSWMFCDGNPAALEYGSRAGAESLPIDDDVVYGKIGPFGKLMHVSQIDK